MYMILDIIYYPWENLKIYLGTYIPTYVGIVGMLLVLAPDDSGLKCIRGFSSAFSFECQGVMKNEYVATCLDKSITRAGIA